MVLSRLYQNTLPVLKKLYPSYGKRSASWENLRQLLALGINAKLLQTFGMAVAGSPEQCITALSKYRAAGVTHLLLAVGAGALPTEVVRESMQCIAQDVMPALQDQGLGRGMPRPNLIFITGSASHLAQAWLPKAMRRSAHRTRHRHRFSADDFY